jgi:MoaA/NifB/PqqE/SkfB family radical SAM enzyme
MLMGLGYRYISEGKYNEALKIFNKVLKEALTEPFVVAVNEEKKELNCDSQVFDVYWNIAVTYEKLKLNNLAIKELVLGIKLLEDSLDDVNALRTYKNIEAEKFIRKIYELKITKYDVDGLNEVCRLMKSTKLLAGYVPYFTNEIKGLEEFLEKKRILESMPRSMLISLTGKCNLRCIMCGDPKIPWEVSEHTVNEIIDMMPYLRDIQWRGGEAFFCGNFKKLFESAARYPHLKQSINTNGTLLTKEWIERIVETNTTIVFSIDGITKESYEHIRRGANYKQVLGNLEALAKYRDKYKSAVTGGFCGTNIEMTFVIMKSNYKDLEHIVEFVKKYKIDVLRLSKMICSPSFEENINPEIYEYVANKISRIKSELKQINVDFRDWSIDKPRDVPELGSITKAIRPALPAAAQESGIRKEDINADNAQESFCRAPYSLLFINTGGDVYPHCFCGAPIGNVDTGSLKDMWNNSLMQMYRAGFKHDNSPKVCKPQELSRCWELMG